MEKLLDTLKNDKKGAITHFGLGSSVPIFVVLAILMAKYVFASQSVWIAVSIGATIVAFFFANRYATRVSGPLLDGYSGFLTRMVPYILGAASSAYVFIPLLSKGR